MNEHSLIFTVGLLLGSAVGALISAAIRLITDLYFTDHSRERDAIAHDEELAALRAELERLTRERADTIRLLREQCANDGDNDWSDNLHLADIIEKHLLKHLWWERDEAKADADKWQLVLAMPPGSKLGHSVYRKDCVRWYAAYGDTLVFVYDTTPEAALREAEKAQPAQEPAGNGDHADATKEDRGFRVKRPKSRPSDS